MTHRDWSWKKKKKENLIKVDKIDLGFGVDTTLKKLGTADLASKAKVTEFKKECQQLVIAMVSKLFEKALWVLIFSYPFLFCIVSFLAVTLDQQFLTDGKLFLHIFWS